MFTKQHKRGWVEHKNITSQMFCLYQSTCECVMNIVECINWLYLRWELTMWRFRYLSLFMSTLCWHECWEHGVLCVLSSLMCMTTIMELDIDDCKVSGINVVQLYREQGRDSLCWLCNIQQQHWLFYLCNLMKECIKWAQLMAHIEVLAY